MTDVDTICPRCNHEKHGVEEKCGPEVLTLRCFGCGHVYPAHLARASAWRGDIEFCKLAQEMWSEDYRLATAKDEKGSYKYDKGAAQKLQYRWQGMNALVSAGILGNYLDVHIIAVRPHQWDDDIWKIWKERFRAKLNS